MSERMTNEPNPSDRGIEMTAIPYDRPEQGWDGYDDEQTMPLPGRPRRRFWGRGTAVLLALLLGGIGFYVGIRVEKSQLSSSSSTGSGLAAALASARGGASGAAGTRGTSGAGSARSFTGTGRGLFSGAFGGGNSSFGTVSSVSGHTLYVTETGTGNVVKVDLSSATKITKSVSVGKSSINPGDTVVVQGVKGSGGTLSATSVSDTGASGAATGGTGSGSGGAGGGSSSGSAGAAVNSLFGGGGG
jgi:hypothetical protein